MKLFEAMLLLVLLLRMRTLLQLLKKATDHKSIRSSAHVFLQLESQDERGG